MKNLPLAIRIVANVVMWTVWGFCVFLLGRWSIPFTVLAFLWGWTRLKRKTATVRTS